MLISPWNPLQGFVWENVASHFRWVFETSHNEPIIVAREWQRKTEKDRERQRKTEKEKGSEKEAPATFATGITGISPSRQLNARGLAFFANAGGPTTRSAMFVDGFAGRRETT